jgi:signal transduction histidine kinase
MKQPIAWAPWFETALVSVALGWLTLYTYLLFIQLPYAGFEWDTSTQQVNAVWSAAARQLQVGDRLIQVADMSVADYKADVRRPFWPVNAVGGEVPLVLERQGRRLTVTLQPAAFALDEFSTRVQSQWFLAWAFWLGGSLTFLIVRPRDRRWRLLIAFQMLTATFISASTLSRWQLGESALVLRTAIWLSVPVYWHLHLVFPQPLSKPAERWLIPVYALSLVLAIGQAFQIWPDRWYVVALLLAILGLAGLTLTRLWIPAQRTAAGPLVVAVVAAIGPLLILALQTAANIATPTTAGALLALPILPLYYFYAAYRRQLGRFELRANRAIVLYLYGVVIITASVVMFPVFRSLWPDAESEMTVSVAAIGFVSIVSVTGFPYFQRFTERRLLGITRRPEQLLESFVTRLVVSADQAELLRLLRTEILPSLLVKQSALVLLEEAGTSNCLYCDQVGERQLPAKGQLSALVADGDLYQPAGEPIDADDWIRLVLPLRLNGQMTGLWMFGRRDPDDLYSQSDIRVLRALADQMAITLAHIQQTNQLRRLYQANITRQETERAQLARDLHDEILNELGVLANRSPSAAEHNYARIVQRVRQMISDLRPVMLNYGLGTALEQWGDDLAERVGSSIAIRVELTDSSYRYPTEVEDHLFRIVQQACENALKHGRPKTLTIAGDLQVTRLTLTVYDDGVGLPDDLHRNLDNLLENQHYGLAGMHERAALIGARLMFDSTPGQGTRVCLEWDDSQRSGHQPSGPR